MCIWRSKVLSALLLLLSLILANGCASQASVPSIEPSTNTPLPPTSTPLPPTASPIPPTSTPNPTETPTPNPSPTPLLNPVAQGYHPMAYDAESNIIVLVPRQESVVGDYIKTIHSETWIFDLNTKTWQMRDGPPKGEGPMAYDAQSDRTILFIGAQTPGGGELYSDGQTWAYDANTDTWTNMKPAESPFGLLGARMVYDLESDRMILFSGADLETWSHSLETWAYDYETNTWTNMQPAGSPPPGENFFAMSYDIAADRVIAWKRIFNSSTGMVEFKIGVYDYNSNTWQQRETETHPNSILYNAMVYDPGTRLNILFGGVDFFEVPMDETWGYDYASNSWQPLPAKNPPSARGWHAMVYHAQGGVLVLFGGGASREEFTNETWVYDPISGEWSNNTVSP